MMDKTYHLAIFWGSYKSLDDVPDDLITFKTQEELDDFTKKFDTDDDLRAFFDQKIGELALENRDKIKKNETKNGRFLGRISAYYIDENGKMIFVKVAYRNRIIVRDYHELKTLRSRINFFESVLDELEKRFSKKPKEEDKEKRRVLSINDRMFVAIKTYEKYGYYVSDNEKYYLKIFLTLPTIENKKKFLGFVRNNLKSEIDEIKATEKEMHNMIDDYDACDCDESRYELYDMSDEMFVSLFEKAIRKNNFEELFKYYSVDYIAKKCNYFEIQGKGGKTKCIK